MSDDLPSNQLEALWQQVVLAGTAYRLLVKNPKKWPTQLAAKGLGTRDEEMKNGTVESYTLFELWMEHYQSVKGHFESRGIPIEDRNKQ